MSKQLVSSALIGNAMHKRLQNGVNNLKTPIYMHLFAIAESLFSGI